jgi:hypothetical protein
MAGHPGESVMYYNIRNFYYVPRIKSVIESAVKECALCKMNKDQRKQVYGAKIEANKLFERVSSDVFEPIEVSKMGLSSTRKKVYVITI